MRVLCFLCSLTDVNVFSVARHASERYSSSKVLILLAILLQAVGIDFGMARMLNYLLFKLPNSRTQELEGEITSERQSHTVMLTGSNSGYTRYPHRCEGVLRPSIRSGVNFPV